MSRLLLLCEYAVLHGAEESMLSTLDAVASSGFVVSVAAPPEGPLADALRGRDIEVLPFRVHDASGVRRPQDELREELAELLRRRRPDLLHANSLSMGRLSGPVAVELAVPSLAHLRDIVRLSRQAVADLNCHRRLLAVSEATRTFHLAGGLSVEKTHVLHNGVDLTRFRPRPRSGYLNRELGLPAEARLVGAIGQISLRKGPDVLAQAATILATETTNLHWILVGGRTSEKDESRRLEADLRAAAAGPLAGRLHLLESRHDVAELLGELTLLVHPSRQEPLGRVLLEAAAAGLPVVATDVGGTREIFPPESHSARLVPSDDPQALAEGVRELLDDSSLRGRLAQAARRRVEQAFDIRQAAPRLVTHYCELVRT
jgi:glycosyltransferase involved in cell wall biosynthesis